MEKVYVIVLDKYESENDLYTKKNLVVVKNYNNAIEYAVRYWGDLKQLSNWSFISDESINSWMIRDKHSASYIDLFIEEVNIIE